METRSEELARQFETANNELITLVGQLNSEQWNARCPGQDWTVAQAACHLAEDHAVLAGFVRLVAEGQPLPYFEAADVHQINAEQVARNGDCTREQVLELLRTNGASAAAMVREFTDEHLTTAASPPETHAFRVMDGLHEHLTVEHAIRTGLIGHLHEHGPRILSAVYPSLTAAH
jgi:hypothetical protein